MAAHRKSDRHRDDLCGGELRKRAQESDRFELYKRPGVTTINPKRMRRKITNETWEQIKLSFAAGINLRELARRMNILEAHCSLGQDQVKSGSGTWASSFRDPSAGIELQLASSRALVLD